MKKNFLLILSIVILPLFGGCGKQKPTTPADNPPQPVALFLTGSGNATASLVWSKNTDGDFACYKIHRSTTAGITGSSLCLATHTAQDDTAYVDTTLSPSRAYHYAVYVTDAKGQSAKSNEVNVNTSGLSSLTIGMDPRFSTVFVDSCFVIDVWVESAADLFGASFELLYDNTLIIADSAKAGSFLGNEIIFFSQFDSGRVSIANTRKAGAGGVTGRGTLAAVYFHAIGAGSCAIAVGPNLALRKEDGTNVAGFSAIAKWNSRILVQFRL